MTASAIFILAAAIFLLCDRLRDAALIIAAAIRESKDKP